MSAAENSSPKNGKFTVSTSVGMNSPNRELPTSLGSTSPATPGSPPGRKESLIIRSSDEARIIAGIRDAAKKVTTGSTFSIKVDISKTGTLGLGIKDLPDNLLAVSMLKRINGLPGPGELAGIKLGDLVFGINFVAVRDGSKTLLELMRRETDKGKTTLYLQCWRCHQLCPDPVPGTLFPRVDDMFVQSYAMLRNRVFSEWERWNYIEILLSHMMEDIRCRAQLISLSAASRKLQATNANLVDSAALDEQVNKILRQRQLLSMEPDEIIMQAKGLRSALCVRVVHTKAQSDTVLYVLRVEDVQTGLQWVVHRRFRDFYALHEELIDMSQFTKNVEFPKKRISIRNTAKLVENRIIALEKYIRRVLHVLTLYATIDPQASRSLRHLQDFLCVDKHIDCVHPPKVDDQRFLELMAYRYLNDFSSPACQQCIRFVSTIDLDSIATSEPNGYEPVLKTVSQALSEVEQFVMQQHQQQMMTEMRERLDKMAPEDLRSFVRKCVRRQVEAALFLPLRRTIFRIVYPFIANKAEQMQRALAILQQAPPEYFTVDPCVLQATSLTKAVKCFREVIQGYLPADQGQLLLIAAAAVVDLHAECQTIRSQYEGVANAELNLSNQHSSDTLSASSRGNSNSRSDSHNGNDCLLANNSSTNYNGNNNSNDLTATDGNKAAMERAKIKSMRRMSRGASLAALESLKAELNLTHKDVLADPVQTMFASEETIPEKQRLHSGSSGSVVGGNGGTSGDFHSSSNNNKSSNNNNAMNLDIPDLDEVKEEIIIQFREQITIHSESRNDSTDKMPSDVHLQDGCNQQGQDGQNNGNNDNNDNDNDNNSNIASNSNNRMTSVHFSEVISTDIINSDYRSSDCNNNELEPSLTSVDNSCNDANISNNKSDISDPSNASLTDNGETDVTTTTIVTANTSSTTTTTTTTTDTSNCTSCSSTDAGLDDDEVVLATASATEEGTTGEGTSCGGGTEEGEETVLTSLDPNIDHAPAASFLETSIVVQRNVISADDFLPLFTYVLVQAALPQLLLVKELMVSLVDDEETFGECGYYLATLEASTQHIVDLAENFEKIHLCDDEVENSADLYENAHFDIKDLTR